MNIRLLYNNSQGNDAGEDRIDPLDVIDEPDNGVRSEMLTDMDPLSKPSAKGTTRSGHGTLETTRLARTQQ